MSTTDGKNLASVETEKHLKKGGRVLVKNYWLQPELNGKEGTYLGTIKDTYLKIEVDGEIILMWPREVEAINEKTLSSGQASS